MAPSPFFSIWTQPRATVGAIIAENAELHVSLLACLAGIAQALDRAATRNLGDKIPLAGIIVLVLLVGAA